MITKLVNGHIPLRFTHRSLLRIVAKKHQAVARTGFMAAMLVMGQAPTLSGAMPSATSTLSGLVAYWPFDEGHGNSASNVMGLEGDVFSSREIGQASMSNAVWARGRLGQAMKFPANGPGLQVEDTDALDCDAAVTVAAWVRLDGTPGRGGIWSNGRACALGIEPDGNRVQFTTSLDGQWTGNSLRSATSLERGRWYHVAGVYDGRERRIYLDGKLDAREPASGSISRGGRMLIGQGFAGLIDELRIWNRATSEVVLRQAMEEDRAQHQERMRPVHSLRFYPVKCVAMQGSSGQTEIALFNTAGRSFQDKLEFAIVGPDGTTLSQEARVLTIPTREKILARFAFQPREAGRCTFVVRSGTEELHRSNLLALAPLERSTVGKMKLKRVMAIDLSQNLGPDLLCEDGESRIVDSPLGPYREAAPRRFSRFVVRTPLNKTGLHLLRITYPDDKARTCEITAWSPAPPDRWNVQTGYSTGGVYPLSNRLQTMDCVLWARDVNQAVGFITWTENQPAAAARVEVFEIEGRLPAAPASVGPSARQIGLYWEDAQPFTWCLGGEGRSLEAFDRVVTNLCDYMDYSGQNVLYHPAVWYDGPVYNSLVETRVTGRGGAGGADFPTAGWMEILLHRFTERGFKFYPTLNVHRLASLVVSMNADETRVKAGEPTYNAVTWDNKVLSETWHHQPPAFNALHPRVSGQVLALVDELADRYAQSPAFGGVLFHLTKCQLLQLGGLEIGYDDWSIAEFEKDTGLTLPVAERNPERFSQRYEWLMANAKERWIAWRCARMADYYGEAARRLQRHRSDLQLVLSMWVPALINTDVLKRWQAGERLIVQTREQGVDPTLLGTRPGIALQKYLGPSDHRWRIARARPGTEAEKTALSIRAADFNTPQMLDYRTTGQFSVFLYNRCFESQSSPEGKPGYWKPIRTDWYQDPSWRASAVAPAHEHFMEYYAHSMALYDPVAIAVGGFTVGTVGHEGRVERFARVFRQLPVGDWESIPGLGEHVAGRTLRTAGKRYLYLVNDSPQPRTVTLPDSVARARMQPLGPSPDLLRVRSGHDVTLEPYQLAAWTSN